MMRQYSCDLHPKPLPIKKRSELDALFTTTSHIFFIAKAGNKLRVKQEETKTQLSAKKWTFNLLYTACQLDNLNFPFF